MYTSAATKTTKIIAFGSATSEVASDANQPIDWIPRLFEMEPWTDPGQPDQSPSPEESWASLAAAARADWAADNPF